MTRYVGRKLLLLLPLVWGVVTLTFLLVELAPGSVADKYFSPEATPEQSREEPATGLWTPGSEKPAEDKPKLWTPDMG